MPVVPELGAARRSRSRKSSDIERALDRGKSGAKGGELSAAIGVLRGLCAIAGHRDGAARDPVPARLSLFLLLVSGVAAARRIDRAAPDPRARSRTQQPGPGSCL